ncbi:MAG TPA: hypothetical protein VNT26_04545, partial [Candidatus Sulfotelmatobacter sp.]|nr:hypothetical protein [Candidatus Sulfotelmatobacter sp.]
LNKAALGRLEGTPLPQDAALDELRLKDLPTGTQLKAGGRLDPLMHYAGQVEVRFVDTPGAVKLADLKPLIDHTAQMVTSSTGELKLNYGKGVLTMDAARAQGASGLLSAAGPIETKDLAIASEMELGHIVAVSLDNQPLATSGKILLQVMSEEKSSGFQAEPAGPGVQRIANIGADPWLVKELKGTVKLKRADAAQLKVTALDFNGYPAGEAGTGQQIKLEPKTVYYLIGR